MERISLTEWQSVALSFDRRENAYKGGKTYMDFKNVVSSSDSRASDDSMTNE
jgi:hypothetical protein